MITTLPLEQRLELIDVALGRKPADLVIKNGRLVDVNTAQIYEADVAIKGDRIACVGDVSHTVGKTPRIIDAKGQYLAPGLMDAHLHIESSNVTITELARVIVPKGVTSIMWDPHEVANALGKRGIELFLEEAKGLPLRVFLRVPGSVPGVMGYETALEEFDFEMTKELLDRPEAVALAGDVNPNLVLMKILDGGRLHLQKIEYALSKKLTIYGQIPAYLTDAEVNGMAAGGKMDSHVSSELWEVMRLLKLGIKAILRTPPIEQEQFKELAKAIKERKLDARHILMCVDDKLISRMNSEGSMDHNVRLAIEGGIDPVVAVQMATINCADHCYLSADLGSIAPGKLADIVILDNLERFVVDKVVANGELVAEKGKMLVDLPTFKFPEWSKHTVCVKREVTPEDFEIKVPIKTGKVKVRVIPSAGLRLRIPPLPVEELRVEDGKILPDVDRDIVKQGTVERHIATGNINCGFIKDTGVKKGAIASSYSHDAHNICVIGTNSEDMAAAVNKVIDIEGGIVIAENGKILGLIKLPICGFISDEPAEVAIKKFEELDRIVRQIGWTFQPWTLDLSTSVAVGRAFLNIGVSGQSDKCLFDIQAYKPVDPIVKES